MKKKLSEMSLEELWQLFPIQLAEHRDCWEAWYAEEEALLRDILPEGAALNHIGSTAVKGIWAKPIIDILAEIPRDCEMNAVKDMLADGGYLCMSAEDGRMSFNKGYTEDGFAERVFHLHVRYPGDNGELYFRDWLREMPGDAAEYERLKLSLKEKYEHDRDAYTNAKTDFITERTEKARLRYRGRYE